MLSLIGQPDNEVVPLLLRPNSPHSPLPYGMVVDNILLRHVFSAVLFPARAWDVIVVPKLNIMVRAIAATDARDLGSDFSLPKLRN